MAATVNQIAIQTNLSDLSARFSCARRDACGCGSTSATAACEAVDVNKIVRAVDALLRRACTMWTRCASRSRRSRGLYDGATTRELDELSIRTAASFILEEPEYSRLAARLLSASIDKEVQGLGVHSFSQSIAYGLHVGLINESLRTFVKPNARKLNARDRAPRTDQLEYFGLRTVYDRYLLRHPTRA